MRSRVQIALLAGVLLAFSGRASGQAEIQSDICVYGATPAGIVAAIRAAGLGRSVTLIAPDGHVGGMPAAGLGATDVGNRRTMGGLAAEFFRRIREHYVRRYGDHSAQVRDCRDGLHFEPHVAARVFSDWLREARLPPPLRARALSAVRNGTALDTVRLEGGRMVRARIYIDATYEGDLLALARVSHVVGREPNSRYGETLNGVQLDQPYHAFRVAVDPHRTPGRAESGLLPLICDEEPGRPGDGDDKVQAYNFRLCLTADPANRIPFPRPAAYDPSRYELLARYIRGGGWEGLHLSMRLPNGKVDCNNLGAISTDHVGGSWDYPTGDPARRRAIVADHESYQKGLLWFLSQDSRVPDAIRAEVAKWGLARDEFTSGGGWPPQLYVREARRLVGEYVITEADCRGRRVAADGVALASYPIDSHHVQRLVRRGRVINEGDIQVGGFPPFPVSYRALMPRRRECRNLLVPVCLSATHVAYGSIRMEPVYMMLGHVTGVAADLAIRAGVPVQDVEPSQLQQLLRRDGIPHAWSELGGDIEAPYLHPRSLPGLVLDDQEAERFGPWSPAAGASARRVGSGYLQAPPDPKEPAVLIYRTTLPAAGSYRVFVLAPPGTRNAARAPVELSIEGGGSVRRVVDMRDLAATGFLLLGTYKLPGDTPIRISLTTAGADGWVVSDGVQFLAVP